MAKKNCRRLSSSQATQSGELSPARSSGAQKVEQLAMTSPPTGDTAKPLSLEGVTITPQSLAVLEQHQQILEKEQQELGAKLEKSKEAEKDPEVTTAVELPAPSSPAKPKKTRRRKSCTRWTTEEDERLMEAVRVMGAKNWNAIAKMVGTKNGDQCNQHWHRVLNPRISRKPWTREEDATLKSLVTKYGQSSWKKIAEHVEGRTDIQCRHRWLMLKRQAERAARPQPVKVRKKTAASLLKESRKRSASDVLPRKSSLVADGEVKKRGRSSSSARLKKDNKKNITPKELMELSLLDPSDNLATGDDLPTTGTDSSTTSFDFEMYTFEIGESSVMNQGFSGSLPFVPIVQATPPPAKLDSMP